MERKRQFLSHILFDELSDYVRKNKRKAKKLSIKKVTQ